MTTKTQIIYFLNPQPKAWGDCQRETARFYLALRSLNQPAVIAGFPDQSHVWLESGKWVIDVVLHNKVPVREVIFEKTKHKQLLKQYIYDYQTKGASAFEPEAFVARWKKCRE